MPKVGPGWLEPLLLPIQANRRSLTVPVIDAIHWQDFHIFPIIKQPVKTGGKCSNVRWSLLRSLLAINEEVETEETYYGGKFCAGRLRKKALSRTILK